VAYGGRTNHTEAAVSIAGDGWAVDTRVPLLGAFQATNAGVAATLARQVDARLADGRGCGADGAAVDETALARGLRKASWPGRFEVMDTDPLVVLDGAHNPGAAGSLADTLAEFDYDALRVVAGVMHDKDHEGIAAALPTPDQVVACRPDVDRAEDEAVVADVFRAAGAGDVATRPTVRGALETALSDAEADDLVLVMGSLYTVAAARPRWTGPATPREIRDGDDAAAALSDVQVTDAGVVEMRDDAVHHAVQVRVRHREATLLREHLLDLGGQCAVGAVEDDEEPVDALLLGTRARFDDLTDRLSTAGPGSDAGETGTTAGTAALAREIAGAVGSGDGGGPAATGPRGADRDDGDLPWSDGPAVMGVLNVTPDSFHDGGEYDRVADAVARAEELVAAGADIVDVGGESTRPGADPVPVEEEIDRVVPVVERLADLEAAVSVDTRKAEVARAALEAGADVLNDVSGLSDPEMRFLAAEYDAPLVVMHSVNTPVDPDADPTYDDVVGDVVAELDERVLLAEKAGLDRERIVVDPGLGFGKTAAESFELVSRLGELRALGCPVMVGHSHKSMFAAVGGEPGDALQETVAATALATRQGADVVRVHDVAENVAAVRTALGVDDPAGLQ
jgi:dihydropteroate synthase